MFKAKAKRFLNAFPTSSSCHCAALAVPTANRSNWPQADGQTFATFWQTQRERVAVEAEEFHKICESATNYNGKYWSEMSADCLSCPASPQAFAFLFTFTFRLPGAATKVTAQN